MKVFTAFNKNKFDVTKAELQNYVIKVMFINFNTIVRSH